MGVSGLMTTGAAIAGGVSSVSWHRGRPRRQRLRRCVLAARLGLGYSVDALSQFPRPPSRPRRSSRRMTGVEFVELPQRRWPVSALGVALGQREVGELVGRVRSQVLVPVLGLVQQVGCASDSGVAWAVRPTVRKGPGAAARLHATQARWLTGQERLEPQQWVGALVIVAEVRPRSSSPVRRRPDSHATVGLTARRSPSTGGRISHRVTSRAWRHGPDRWTGRSGDRGRRPVGGTAGSTQG